MKKVVMTGISGFAGSAILNEALNRGFYVTVVIRHPKEIKIKNENLEVKRADVSSLDEVCEVCQGVDTVISAPNLGWNNPSIYKETIEVYLTIIDGVGKAGISRFLVVGRAGSSFIAPGIYLVDSGEVPEEILPGIGALSDFYPGFLKKGKEIDWVFFSPVADMAPGVHTGGYRLGKDSMIVGIVDNSHISMEDYATVMVNKLEKLGHYQERSTIGY